MICFRINQRILGGFRQGGCKGQDQGAFVLRESVMFISIHDLEITRDFSFFTSNTMHLVSAIKELTPPLTENRNSWSTCKPFFTGLNYCTTGTYSNTSSYFPLIGDTRSAMLNVSPSICLPSTLRPPNRATEKTLCVVGLFHKPQGFAPSINYLKQWSSTRHT